MTKYTAMIVRLEDDSEVLRFEIDDDQIDVALTRQDGVNGLKDVFVKLLNALVIDDTEVVLAPKAEGVTSMYQDVCAVWVNDLNSDLSNVRAEMIEQGLRRARHRKCV